MHCPYCRYSDSRVLDSRVAEDGSSIRRRRECRSCNRRFTTLEQMQLVVVKRSGVVEPFSREKVVSGVRKACKGRPVTEAQLAKLGQRVEESLRAGGQAEIPADEVGVDDEVGVEVVVVGDVGEAVAAVVDVDDVGDEVALQVAFSSVVAARVVVALSTLIVSPSTNLPASASHTHAM